MGCLNLLSPFSSAQSVPPILLSTLAYEVLRFAGLFLRSPLFLSMLLLLLLLLGFRVGVLIARMILSLSPRVRLIRGRRRRYVMFLLHQPLLFKTLGLALPVDVGRLALVR